MKIVISIIICFWSGLLCNIVEAQPSELDGMGLFVLPKEKVAQYRIKSVKITDYSYEKSGNLKKIKTPADYIEYDTQGNFIKYIGELDQASPYKVTNKYDINANLIESFIYAPQYDSLTYEQIPGNYDLVAKLLYQFDENNRKIQHIAYDKDDNIIGKKSYKYDKKGNNVEVLKLDPKTGEILTKGIFEYDNNGNMIRGRGDGETLYEYDKNNNVIKMIGYRPNGALDITREYRYDDKGNMIEYYWESPGADYWYRFKYKHNDKGLPIEKIMSRKEVFYIGDPDELAKYEYEYFD